MRQRGERGDTQERHRDITKIHKSETKEGGRKTQRQIETQMKG